MREVTASQKLRSGTLGCHSIFDMGKTLPESLQGQTIIHKRSRSPLKKLAASLRWNKSHRLSLPTGVVEKTGTGATELDIQMSRGGSYPCFYIVPHSSLKLSCKDHLLLVAAIIRCIIILSLFKFGLLKPFWTSRTGCDARSKNNIS